MLSQILHIKDWDTSTNQVNNQNAAEVFHHCIVGRDKIEQVLKDIENPNFVVSELRILLMKKRHELYLLQLEADETMNQKFLINKKRKQHVNEIKVSSDHIGAH